MLKTICRFIGRPAIYAPFYYSGKIAGYALWVWYMLSLTYHAKQLPDDDLITVGSLSIFASGIVLALLASFSLGESTRIGLPKEATCLRTSGVYRLSRNPMYVAFAMFSLAAVIFLRGPIALLLAAYSTAVYHFIVFGEEKLLLERFGQAYVEYKERVRRYL